MTRTFRIGTSIAALLAATALLAPDALAADGCAPGTFSVAHSADGRVHTAIFTDFIVDAGSAGPDTAADTCATEIAPATGGYSLYTADYRGFAIIDTGQTATFTEPNGDPTATAVTGPHDPPDVIFGQLIALDPGEALMMNFTIELNAAAGPDAQAGLDTADYARIGFTTFASVEASMIAIANSLSAAMNQLRGTADYLLLGGIGPFDASDGIGAIAAAGSAFFGVTGRLTPTEGITILGGAALLTQTAGVIDIGFSPLLAGAVRYVLPGSTPSRFFLEAGLTAAPRLGLTIARPYENNGAMTEGIGTTDGRLLTLFGRAGTNLDLGAGGELVLATTLAHDVLQVSAYAETMSPENPFPASFDAARYATRSRRALLGRCRSRRPSTSRLPPTSDETSAPCLLMAMSLSSARCPVSPRPASSLPPAPASASTPPSVFPPTSLSLA